MQPEVWQPVPTLFEQAGGRGLDAVVIGAPQYRDSGFTHAVSAAPAISRAGARPIGPRR